MGHLTRVAAREVSWAWGKPRESTKETAGARGVSQAGPELLGRPRGTPARRCQAGGSSAPLALGAARSAQRWGSSSPARPLPRLSRGPAPAASALGQTAGLLLPPRGTCARRRRRRVTWGEDAGLALGGAKGAGRAASHGLRQAPRSRRERGALTCHRFGRSAPLLGIRFPASPFAALLAFPPFAVSLLLGHPGRCCPSARGRCAPLPC